MNEDLDGNDPEWVEWTQQVTRRLSIKPVDDVSFTKHNKCLRTHMPEGDMGQRDGDESKRDRKKVKQMEEAHHL